ncbi:MAG: RsmE family RNA methyltransferase [Spirochaetota bacterium]
MRQLLLSGERSAGEQVEIAGEDHHYLARVLRLGPGDTFPVLDDAARRWTGCVVDDAGDRFLIRLDEPADSDDDGEPAVGLGTVVDLPPVTLYQAIPKGRKFDEPLRQLVQAGVTTVVPIVTERTIVRPEGGGARLDRWQRIAREAVQQSGAGQPARVLEPESLGRVQPSASALSLFLHPEPLAQTSLHGYLGEVPRAIELVVGPEGGFSPPEVDYLLRAGFSSLWLGPQVLRAESAGLFAAAAIRILILERAQWQPASP